MRILKKLLPHLTIALAVALLVVVIVDGYNPRMGFLMGKPFQILTIAEILCTLVTSLFCIFSPGSKTKRPKGRYEKE